MLDHGVEAEEREVNAAPLTAAELEALIGKRDATEFLNPKNELYRERDMKKKPPSRAEAVKLMAANPNLLRRPILVVGGQVLLWFDESKWKETLG